MKFVSIDLSRDQDEPLVLGWKNLFTTLWREIFTLIRANLCFLLFCLPVITIPPAMCALHGVCMDAIRGKKCRVLRCFLDTLRRQFLQSWAAALAFGAVEFAAVFGAWFYFTRAQGNWVVMLLGLLMSAIAVVGYLMVPYCLTMLARVDLPMVKAVKNAFLLAFLNLRFSICSGVIVFALLTVWALLWLYVIPLLLLCAFSLTAYAAVYFSLFGLQKFVLTEEL